MAKKGKVKKTLVDQILDKANIDHDSLSFNGLEGELPEDVARESIYKTLALKGDKTGPVMFLDSCSPSRLYPHCLLHSIHSPTTLQWKEFPVIVP